MAANSNSTDGVLLGNYTPGIATSALATAKAPSSEMDKDAFLKLLIAQMKYQDPLNPMDDKEFVAQLAQFSALEQMQNLNQAYAKSQAYGMIGRMVTGMAYTEATNSYDYVDGTVLEVKVVNGEPYLVVQTEKGIKELALTRVETIGEDITRLSLLSNINNNIYNTENLQLVGQYVQAITIDENGKASGYVEGIVDSIRFGVNSTMLVVNGREISPGEVISVGDSGMIIQRENVEISCYLMNKSTGEMEWVTGPLEDIIINGDNIYAVVQGREVPFDKLDTLVKAINLVGHAISSYGTNSMVTGVRLESGSVYVYTDDGRQLLVTEVRQIS